MQQEMGDDFEGDDPEGNHRGGEHEGRAPFFQRRHGLELGRNLCFGPSACSHANV